MSPQEAAMAEYFHTITNLQVRLANSAAFAAEQKIRADELEKRVAELTAKEAPAAAPTPAPDLKIV
jgi:hypothetical protein